jgi:hypothetical protein
VAFFQDIQLPDFNFTSARLFLANSISISLNDIRHLLNSASFPASFVQSQFHKVDGGSGNLWVASGIAASFPSTILWIPLEAHS